MVSSRGWRSAPRDLTQDLNCTHLNTARSTLGEIPRVTRDDNSRRPSPKKTLRGTHIFALALSSPQRPPFNLSTKPVTLSFRPRSGNRMSLASLLSSEQIIPEMKATERWPAIVELIDLLVRLGKINPAGQESILAALKQREETMSTGIGFGIAIPHASSDNVSEVVAAFGRSSQGIEFDALDDAPVKFVVLFIVPKNQFQTHLRTLASIAKFLNDRSVRDNLAAAKSQEEILSIFQERAPQ